MRNFDVRMWAREREWCTDVAGAIPLSPSMIGDRAIVFEGIVGARKYSHIRDPCPYVGTP